MQLSWDAYQCPGASLKDLDLKKAGAFIKKVNERGRLRLVGSTRQCLAKLGFIKDNKPTNAAMVFFAKKPLSYDVHVGRLKTPSLILDDRIIRGGLFDVLEETMRYIIGQLKVAFEITGTTTQRTDIFEYPNLALRELVLNALVHRDYTSPVDTQIKIYDKRIEIFNPGRLFGNLTIEDLKTDTYQSRARNKLIVEAFYLTGDIEKYGTGYIRVRNAIIDYPTMRFDYRETGDGYLVELSYDEQKVNTTGGQPNEDVLGVKLGAKLGVKLGVNQKRILDAIGISSGITISELSKLLGISATAVEKNINKLKASGVLERVGADKNGYWKVNGNGYLAELSYDEQKVTTAGGGLDKGGLGVKLGVKLGVNQKRILDAIGISSGITISELSKLLGISATAVEKNIIKLKASGILERVGADKNGYWKVI